MGKDLGLDGFFLLGRNGGDRCVLGHRRRLDRDRCKLLDERAGLGIDEPHQSVGAGGGQDLAVGTERDGIDSALRDLDVGDLLDPVFVVLLQLGGFRRPSGRSRPFRLIALILAG